MIIDCHTHIGKSNNKDWKPEDLIASMDVAGIDYSIIIAESEAGGELSSIDSILKITAKQPRLKAVVDCSYKTLDIQQTNRIINLLEKEQAVAVKFYLGYEAYYPNNEKLYPIYEYCQKNGKPVIFHTGILETGLKGLLKYSHPLNVDEVANIFPGMKIVMAHMGNPWLLDCAAVLAKNKNVYADMSGFFEENTPIDHDDITIFKERLLDAELFLGNYEKFLFGTDWPLYNQKEYLEAIEAIDLDPREKDLVLWKNAKNIFNLSV
jgi:predicted TIM-barrel fold metal-dependent hydrolase